MDIFDSLVIKASRRCQSVILLD